MNLVMIAVHKTGNKIIGFRILDTDSKDIRDVPIDNLKKVISDGKVQLDNVKLEGDRILGSNGALQRYPILVNNKLSGKSPLIIICELVNNCYRVSNYMGSVVDIEEQRAIEYSKSEGISNGKIVTLEDGTSHISSIVGSYRQDKLILDKKSGERLVAKMKLLGVKNYGVTDKYKAYKIDDDIEVLNLGTGILGVENYGFKGCRKLSDVTLPTTLENIGESAFIGCVSLKRIVIPEGVTNINPRTFMNCVSLEEVILPNSVRHISKSAFQNCKKLKRIERGRQEIDIEYGAIPRGVTMPIRR